MRIGLIGVGGTGKGRLAKAFYEKHQDIKFIPSVIQHIGQIVSPDTEHYKEIEPWQKPSYQQTILMAQAECERVFDNLGMSFITAQSIIDFAPYYDSVISMMEGMMSQRDMKATYDSYMTIIKKYLREASYDILFYVPLDLETEDTTDTWKKADAFDKQRMDERLRSTMQDVCLPMGIKVVTLNNGTDEEKIAQIENVLSEEGYKLA